MAVYRDEVERISLPMVRARVAPRVFRTLQSVTLQHDGHEAVVALRRLPHHTAHGGIRTVFACPRCGAAVFVVGCESQAGWGCSKCLRWRGRNRLASTRPVSRRLDGELSAQ